VGKWLSAFVDDDPEAVDALRSGRVRAHSFDELSGLRVRELKTVLAAGTPAARTGSGTNRRRRNRTAPHHSQGQGAQRSP